MVGNIALRGVSDYGGGDLPRPAAVVIAYTGQSSSSSDFPPTFIAVSADDRIANVSTVERRVQDLRNARVEVEYHRFRNAGHGFGLGVGTDAEGWIEHAIEFWKAHLPRMKKGTAATAPACRRTSRAASRPLTGPPTTRPTTEGPMRLTAIIAALLFTSARRKKPKSASPSSPPPPRRRPLSMLPRPRRRRFVPRPASCAA